MHLEKVMNQLDLMVEQQEKKMLQEAQLFYPNIVLDDLWQPCDFPKLEASPLFRHEEGVREGLLSAKAALLALARDP